MKYFLDTEFIEDGKTIDLISIGIVSETGRQFYVQNVECNFQHAKDWVWRNVFPYLEHFSMQGIRYCQGIVKTGDSGLSRVQQSQCSENCPWATRQEIKAQVLAFMDPDVHGKPEVWGYYADYDWVAFCQLFGPMVNLPKGFPMWCRDIKQLCVSLGDPKLAPSDIHHALNDAKHAKAMYEYLREYQHRQSGDKPAIDPRTL